MFALFIFLPGGVKKWLCRKGGRKMCLFAKWFVFTAWKNIFYVFPLYPIRAELISDDIGQCDRITGCINYYIVMLQSRLIILLAFQRHLEQVFSNQNVRHFCSVGCFCLKLIFAFVIWRLVLLQLFLLPFCTSIQFNVI